MKKIILSTLCVATFLLVACGGGRDYKSQSIEKAEKDVELTGSKYFDNFPDLMLQRQIALNALDSIGKELLKDVNSEEDLKKLEPEGKKLEEAKAAIEKDFENRLITKGNKINGTEIPCTFNKECFSSAKATVTYNPEYAKEILIAFAVTVTDDTGSFGHLKFSMIDKDGKDISDGVEYFKNKCKAGETYTFTSSIDKKDMKILETIDFKGTDKVK